MKQQRPREEAQDDECNYHVHYRLNLIDVLVKGTHRPLNKKKEREKRRRKRNSWKGQLEEDEGRLVDGNEVEVEVVGNENPTYESLFCTILL